MATSINSGTTVIDPLTIGTDTAIDSDVASEIASSNLSTTSAEETSAFSSLLSDARDAGAEKFILIDDFDGDGDVERAVTVFSSDNTAAAVEEPAVQAPVNEAATESSGVSDEAVAVLEQLTEIMNVLTQAIAGLPTDDSDLNDAGELLEQLMPIMQLLVQLMNQVVSKLAETESGAVDTDSGVVTGETGGETTTTGGTTTSGPEPFSVDGVLDAYINTTRDTTQQAASALYGGTGVSNHFANSFGKTNGMA